MLTLLKRSSFGFDSLLTEAVAAGAAAMQGLARVKLREGPAIANLDAVRGASTNAPTRAVNAQPSRAAMVALRRAIMPL
jgi:hypothetical protein